MKYIKIYNDLKKAILRREIAPHSPVPSEKALTIKYHVSRITAKRALNELEQAGLIERIQGKGSFVKEHGRLKSHQILLVLPFSGNNDLGNYVAGIQQVLKDTTWNLLSMTNNEFLNLNLAQIGKNYAGIIYYPQNLSLEIPHLLELYLHQIPIILLDQTISNSLIPSVISDNVGGGYLACQHLIEQHYQRIAFYSTSHFELDFSSSVAERFLGYVKALRKNEQFSFHSLDSFQLIKNKNKMIAWIKEKKIDSIIAENDVTAFRLLSLFQEKEIKVPEQVGLIGFDNLPITRFAHPQLSSIGQDFIRLGTEAINLLLQQINNPQLIFNKQVTVPVQLIKRASTCGGK